MSNHTFSENSSTPSNPKQLHTIMLIIVTYHAFILLLSYQAIKVPDERSPLFKLHSNPSTHS